MKGKIVAHTFIGGLNSHTFSLAKTNSQPNLPTTQAYPRGQVPINTKKINDLNKLKEYLHGYEDFYNEILAWPTTSEANDQAGSGNEDVD